MKRRKTVSALILILTALFLAAGLSSCNDPEPAPLTDEEALRGQWAVYVSEESDTGTETETADPETQQTEMFSGFIIDIQYTKTGYWFFGRAQEKNPEAITVFYYVENPEAENAADNNNLGVFIKSNRPQEEDGWFIFSRHVGTKGIRYRFTDEERNTMEAEVIFPENEGSRKCIMRRLNHVIEILPLSEAENPEGGEGATTTT